MRSYLFVLITNPMRHFRPILLSMTGFLLGSGLASALTPLFARPYYKQIRADIPKELAEMKETMGTKPIRGLKFTYLDPLLTSFPQQLVDDTAVVSSLKILEIEGHKISAVPPAINNLGALELLAIHASNVSSLPYEIGALINLTILSLPGNRLTTLPNSIGNLTRLEQLLLSHNQIAEIPTDIGNLSNLKVLDLRNNRLKQLPQSLANLSKLQYLYVGGNPLGKKSREHLRQLLRKTTIVY